MAPAPHVPDDTALVDAPVELHHDLARPVVVNVFELVDVPWFARERVGRVGSVEGVKRESRRGWIGRSG